MFALTRHEIISFSAALLTMSSRTFFLLLAVALAITAPSAIQAMTQNEYVNSRCDFQVFGPSKHNLQYMTCTSDCIRGVSTLLKSSHVPEDCGVNDRRNSKQRPSSEGWDVSAETACKNTCAAQDSCNACMAAIYRAR